MSLKELYNNTVSKLSKITDSPTSEASLIFEHIFDMQNKAELLSSDYIPTDKEVAELNSIISKRRERIPLQYILGYAYFYGYKFTVNNDVLIPRTETEVLVESVVSQPLADSVDVLEIGTGSGCISISIGLTLDHRSNDIKFTSTDLSDKAIDVARQNQKTLAPKIDISFLKSDLFENVREEYNIIVSNPPYIPLSDKKNMQHEVLEHEPEKALFGGSEGFEFTLRLMSDAFVHLQENGKLFFEIYEEHANHLAEYAIKRGYRSSEIIKDLNGKNRVLILAK